MASGKAEGADFFRRGQAKYFGTQEGKRNEMLHDSLQESRRQSQLMEKMLDSHQQELEQNRLERTSQSLDSANRIPDYLPPLQVNIDTERLAHANHEIADRLGNVLDAQRDLVRETQSHTPLFRQMVSNQGITHNLVHDLIDSGHGDAVEAFQQRNQQLSHLADLLDLADEQNRNLKTGNQQLSKMNRTVEQGNSLVNQGNRQRTQLIHETARGNELLQAGIHHQQQLIEAANTGNSLLNVTIDQLSEIDSTIGSEASATRNLLQQYLTDIGRQILHLTDEQAVTRIRILHTLSGIQSTFIQTHHEQMLSHQHNRQLLENIVEASWATEQQKEARRLWERSELLRRQGQYDNALMMLQQAVQLDDLNPHFYISLGTIHDTLGNIQHAAIAFTEAETRAAVKNPHMNSYVLMNLASHLQELHRIEHAEQVMWKALKHDPMNREVWFKYAKIAWKTGITEKQNNALRCLRDLLRINPVYYRAQIRIEADFQDLQELIERLSL